MSAARRSRQTRQPKRDAGGPRPAGARPPATRSSRSAEHDALDGLQDAIGNHNVTALLTENGGAVKAAGAIRSALNDPGTPIEPALRAVMEARFGQDFSRVRLHDSHAARASASSLAAEAYTLGADIVLADGPDSSPQGLQLLAHELAHVVQQQGASPATRSVTVAPAETAYEQAADRAAASFASGGPVVSIAGGTAPAALQRKPAPGTATKPTQRESDSGPDVRLDADPATGRYAVTVDGRVIAEGKGPVGGDELAAAGVQSQWSSQNGGTISIDIRTTPNIHLELAPDADSAFPGIANVNIEIRQVQPRLPLISEGPPDIDLFEPEEPPGRRAPEPSPPREVAPRPKRRAEPQPSPESSSTWEDVGEYVHGALDLAGLVPGFGEVADGINALIYLSEGRYAEAAISAAGMIPIVGDAGKAAKWGVKTAREAGEELVERGGREAVEEFTERGVRESVSESAEEAAEAGVRETLEEAPGLARAAGRETAEETASKAAAAAPPAPTPTAKRRRRRKRTSDRPRLKRGKKAARLPANRLRKFSEPLKGEAARAQDSILQLHRRDPLEAGRQYQDLVAKNLRAADVQEISKRAGRRMDVGMTHEVTLEGVRRGFGTSKLDQLWLDLKDRGEVLLTVPKLSKQAADQLARLGAQAEQELGKEVLIIVRETLP